MENVGAAAIMFKMIVVLGLFGLTISGGAGAEQKKLEKLHGNFSSSVHFSLFLNEHNEFALKIMDEKAVGTFAVHTADTFCDWSYYLVCDGRKWHTEFKERGFDGIFCWGDAQHPAVLPLIGDNLESALGTTFAWDKVYELYAVAVNGVKTNTLKFRLETTEFNPSENKGKNQGAFNFKINLINKEHQPWLKISVTNITDVDADWHEGQVLDMFSFVFRRTTLHGGGCRRTFYSDPSRLDVRTLKPRETVYYEIPTKDAVANDINHERSYCIKGISSGAYYPAYSLDIETLDPRQKKSADLHNNYARVDFLVLVKECK